MPRVSVIVPAFNAERYLAETLSSVARQTYRDWEVVVGDDASTDRTAKIAEGFGDGFRVVRARVNGGPPVARNMAIAAATGEMLAFLDADDLWLPEYLESQVRLYDESRAVRDDVGIVSCDARILAEDGFRERTYMEATGPPGEATVTLLLRRNPIFGVLAPGAVVQEVGGFCAELFGTEDYDLWLRIVERGYRVVFNPSVLAVYRLSPGSVSSHVAVMASGVQAVHRRALERGALTRRQRGIARRQLRLYRAVEQTAAASAPGDGRARRYGRVLRTLPLRVLVQLENPSQWRDLLRRLLRRPNPLTPLARSVR